MSGPRCAPFSTPRASCQRHPPRALALEFFTICGRLFNRRLPPDEQIVAFEVVWKRWDFVRDPNHPDFGKVDKRLRFELAESADGPPAK